MEIVFLNRLSKRNEQGYEDFAQVWIGQHEGNGVQAGAHTMSRMKV